MPPTRPWRGRARWLVHHPRTAMTVRAAVAAGLSMLLASRVPGASEYFYYAPLGAVVTMYPTVARSFGESVRGVAAISVGAALAVVADAVIGHSAVVAAVVVGLGVALAGLRWFGDQRSYVPVAALFVLVIGQGTGGYAAAYAGLFLLGALTSVGVNAAFPSVPLETADRALERLRGAVREHLDHLAARLTTTEADADARAPGRPELARCHARAREAVAQIQESVRGNRRARRRPDAVGIRAERYAALERVVLLVDDLYDLTDDEPWGTPVLGVDPHLREPLARALSELSTALTTVDVRDREPGHRHAVDESLRDLTAALQRHEAGVGQDAQALVVAAVLTSLRRVLSMLTPADIRLSPHP